MPMLSIYVDDETYRRLQRAARDTGRDVDELAQCAVAEAALDDERRQGRIKQ